MRGAFEATLILFGLLGAFALNEWQDARTRAVRVDALMTALRTELETNLMLQEEAATYNSEVAENIWSQATSGVTFIPDGTFKRVLMIAAFYEQQADYVTDVSSLFNNMYATILQADSQILRIDGLADPLRIGGVLRDHARRGARLVAAYRATLEQL